MTGADRLVVVTGGPGSGKSTLVDALSDAGFDTVAEAGRKVIREQLAAGGDALPWDDRLAFAREMLAHDAERHEAAARSGRVTFFDRGALGYLKLCGIAPPPELEQRARSRPYAQKTFLAPFWPEIYRNDAERKQDVDEARRTAEVMREIYAALGHEIVELPRASVEARVNFVLAACGLSRSGSRRPI